VSRASGEQAVEEQRGADLAAYQRLVDGTLAALPGIQRLNSTLVMKHIVTDRPLPF
jgi:hypothetical protein